MAQVLAGLLVAAGVLLAGLALSVARTRQAPAGRALAVLLLAAAWWGLAGALELSAADPDTRVLWGDLKYVGIVLVPPAWLVFALLFTGRRAWVTRRTVALLAVEPGLVLAVLAFPPTRLFRYLPDSQVGEALPVVAVGPLFWVHAAYSYLLVLVATVTFIRGLLRVSRAYRGAAVVLTVAAVVPWSANLLFNLGVGPFALVDLTPFLFVLIGPVLVRGLLHGRLTTLASVARDVVVDGLADGVLVVDPLHRVVEANPAAHTLLGGGGPLLGVPVVDLLSGHPADEVELVDAAGGTRTVEVRRQPLLDRSGAPTGQVLVLRDITERRRAEEQLAGLLRERTRVALALQSALRPSVLPVVPGLVTASLYRPAGQGDEIGGDLYELFPLGDGRWCAALGDVAGKGAEAAAVTAQVRFTLRALAPEADGARQLLRSANAALSAAGDDERFCTLALVLLQPHAHGLHADVALAGHLQPLLRRVDGQVETVGVPGTALGLVPDPEVVPTAVELRAGDALCLFTDGLVEARDAAGEELGADRVGDVLGAVDIAGPAGPDGVVRMLEQSARAWHGGDLADDLAVLLLVAAPGSAFQA